MTFIEFSDSPGYPSRYVKAESIDAVISLQLELGDVEDGTELIVAGHSIVTKDSVDVVLAKIKDARQSIHEGPIAKERRLMIQAFKEGLQDLERER